MNTQNDPALILKIAGWKRAITLENSGAAKEVVIREPLSPSPQKRRNLSYHQLIKLLQSFKIKTFYLDVDFGDMPLNGILFPYFYWLSGYSGKTVRINFNGNTVLILVVKNSIARMGWALISSKLKTNPS
ncbi:hypothetical protein CNR22_01810 [Sphingobacteriaceae bacterium]|nr:hypothetical protein CNR22_01810 [Sphingobacteriaceae bacterium]